VLEVKDAKELKARASDSNRLRGAEALFASMTSTLQQSQLVTVGNMQTGKPMPAIGGVNLKKA